MRADVITEVMGTTAEVIVNGDDQLARDAIDRLRDLERSWTRFSSTSELSRLNACAGRTVVVSPDLFGVVARAVEGWRLTGGRFDPSGLAAICAMGYDRTFCDVPANDEAVAPGAPFPGCRDIVLYPSVPAIEMPSSVQLDVGGIGKGWAADVLAAELMAAGAAGACINVGGDLRVMGEAPTAAGWTVGVEHALGVTLRLGSGAVVTSSRQRRRWRRGDRELHHILDPRTGVPVATPVVSVTVVCGSAWLAEVVATALFLAPRGDDADLLNGCDAVAMVRLADGTHRVSEGFDAFAA